MELEPFFVSILGTPACGKSYFLTAMTWELRRVLAQQFAYGFADVDNVSNRNLHEYEELLFLNPKCDELVAMADIIRKTELQGELYDTVQFGDQTVNYPRPFLFAIQPQEGHPNFTGTDKLARVLCLYDNAGEHFLAGQDSTSTPVTQHLAQSRLLLFLFDPTQDIRFRQLCQKRELKSPTLGAGRTSRQEAVLHEAASRVRRYAGLAQNAKHNRPLIVVVTKCDAWLDLLDDRDLQSPWLQLGKLSGLDVERIDRQSRAIRELLLKVTPEIVSAAESFSNDVIYIPVSALGRSPQVDPRTNGLVIRPRDIAPMWATVPLLYGLCRWIPGIIPALKRRAKADVAERTVESSTRQQAFAHPTPKKR
jgi:hypothetical protein